MLVKDKVIIVAGIGPGMGVKVAQQAADYGAKVCVAARTASYVEAVVREISGRGGAVIGHTVDVADEAQCQTLADFTLSKWGRIDGLVNNAFLHGSFQGFETGNIAEWSQVMDVTCFGALRMIKAVLPAMKAQKAGSIVNVSSMGSVQPYPGGAAYATAKAALEGATRQLAKELGQYNIRVNAPRMGRMDGEPWRNALAAMAAQYQSTPDAIEGELRKLIALGKLPPDEHCADAVLYLLSDYSRVITGTAFDVNGGEYMAG